MNRCRLAARQPVELPSQIDRDLVLTFLQSLNRPGCLSRRLGDDERQIVRGPELPVRPGIHHGRRLARYRRRLSRGLPEPVIIKLEHSTEVAELDATVFESPILNDEQRRKKLVEEGNVAGNNEEAWDCGGIRPFAWWGSSSSVMGQTEVQTKWCHLRRCNGWRRTGGW